MTAPQTYGTAVKKTFPFRKKKKMVLWTTTTPSVKNRATPLIIQIEIAHDA